MNLKNHKILVLVTCLLISINLFATDYYVAKNGNDSNSGTIDSPFLTITKAANIAVAGDVVYIREGTYEETLTPKNSGTAGNPIVFQSYNGEKVIISAMESLSGFTQDNGAIYKTVIPFTSLGQENFVMYKETALDLARWPNKTDSNPFALSSLRNTGGSSSDTSTGAYLTQGSIPNIDWTGGAVWFYGDKPGSGWLAWKASITSSSSGRVNFNLNKSPDWIRTFHAPADKGDFYLEGVKAALDYKNEWYFNPTTKELFVQLPNGIAPADLDVKMRRRLDAINIKNKKYIEIRNLAVFGGRIYLEDDTRWTTNTNTTNNVLYGISSFYGSFTQGITSGFSTGKASLELEGSNNIIEKCEIAFSPSSGLRAKGNNHIIKDNLFHDFNYLGFYDAPVVLRGMHNSAFKNNTIYNGGRDGINYNGTNNEIAYNDVSKSNLIADDCALFYTVGKQENTVLHHNWFHDAASSGSKKKAAGIYLDNNPEGIKVHHNVVWNTEWTSIQINWDGKDLEIYNNTLWNGEAVMGAWHKDGTAFSNVKVWNNLGSKNKIDENDANKDWEPQSDKQNNLIVDASVFIDTDNGNFNLKTGSTPINAGREIDGITDGFVGDKPDVGAYENGGDNWTAGITWNPLYGPAELGCFGLPGENCSEVPTDDQDFDGVIDSLDLCADTPADTIVDVNGCPVFTMAADNFSILAIGETCESSNNGKIEIKSKDSSINFTAKIEENNNQKDFTSEVSFDNLIAGTYTLCITTSENTNYKQCFTITITEPDAFIVSSKVDSKKKSITLELEGGKLYRINLNDVITVTDKNQITLDLNDGENKLKVTTEKDCQGDFNKKIVISDGGFVFPSIVKNKFTIALPNLENQNLQYQVISSKGAVVLQKEFTTTQNNIEVNVDSLSSGIYFIKVTGKSINSNTKIIKQ